MLGANRIQPNQSHLPSIDLAGYLLAAEGPASALEWHSLAGGPRDSSLCFPQ